MLSKMFQLRTIVRDVPAMGKLTYCLMRDSRVPKTRKAALLGGLAVASPLIDLSALVPFLGELDALAISMLSARLFIGTCDLELVEYHRNLITSGSSTFDSDLESGKAVAQQWATKVGNLRRKPASDESSEAEVA